jgi:DNA invertase Pin-like site-specific DNA recombinase
MTARPLIGYVRVSTARQGRSGLGIEAQREALARFAASEGFELVRVFLEVETGKGSDALERRPQLAAALSEARRLRCSVAVAKLDRLSRDVHFISGRGASLHQIAEALNARGIGTPRGGRWYAKLVSNALARLA